MIPLMFWIYHQPDTLGSFLAKLAVLGVLISVVPIFLWAFMAKGVVIKRLVKKLSKELGAEKDD